MRSPVLVADPSRLDADATKAFLAATARGFKLAAEAPDAAAAMLAAEENPDLPTPLDADMVAQSARYLAAEGAYLNEAGAWGAMDGARWSSFVTWLRDAGLLTSAMQSRSPDGVNTVSLDDLRAGKAGEVRARARAPGRLLATRLSRARCSFPRHALRAAPGAARRRGAVHQRIPASAVGGSNGGAPPVFALRSARLAHDTPGCCAALDRQPHWLGAGARG